MFLIKMQNLGIENCKLLGRDMIISHYLGFKRISRSYGNAKLEEIIETIKGMYQIEL